MQKSWKLKEKAPGEFFDQFPEYSPQTLQLLWNRGLKTQESIDEFFNPDYDEDLHDPFLFSGMDKAAKRIARAIKRKEKILIFGDYDHDGVSGVALLTIFFREFEVEPEIYIPDRLREGYGLSTGSIKEIISKKVKVLITIDCGITDFEEIEMANEAGIDVIILDHHLPHEKLPQAHAIINAKQIGDTYPFKELSATGVAFKLVQALIKDQRSKTKDQNLPDGWEKWLLDLVTIATVGDIVPLIGENRTLVKYGLVVLAQTRRRGLKALMKKAGIKPSIGKHINPSCKIPITNIDTHSVGFVVVPRINAASRMDHADTAFLLLTTESQEEAERLAERLEGQNRERQNIVDKITREVEQRILAKEKILPVIIEGDVAWSRGVLGIVANRILDKYYRPAFIYSRGEVESAGSVRSMEGFHVVKAMESCDKLFEEFGGHKAAGGFTVKNKNIKKFENAMVKYAKKTLGDNGFAPILEIEIELDPSDITWEVYGEIEKLEPLGEGNPKPLFSMRNLEISELRQVGQNGKHLQLWLKPLAVGHQPPITNKTFRAIYFNGADNGEHLSTGDRVDIVFEFIADEWNGTRELKLKIIDLKQ